MTERVRTSERIDFQRCPTKWYYRWRLGLTPRHSTAGATDLGSWWHTALENWYGKGLTRHGTLADRFMEASYVSTGSDEAGEELQALGLDMAAAYQAHYGLDQGWSVMGAEIPLEFTFSATDLTPAVAHYLKPDMLIQSTKTGKYWLVEHKTATQIETLHLSLDPQATSYVVMAQAALRNAGHRIELEGVLYNFARKTLTDLREQDTQGRYLNKDGSVSKRQPGPQFIRHPHKMTRAAKINALRRTALEAREIALASKMVRERSVALEGLPMNRGKACVRCQFFKLCDLKEQGGDIKGLKQSAYVVRDPYTYGESTEEHVGWEY